MLMIILTLDSRQQDNGRCCWTAWVVVVLTSRSCLGSIEHVFREPAARKKSCTYHGWFPIALVADFCDLRSICFGFQVLNPLILFFYLVLLLLHGIPAGTTSSCDRENNVPY